MCVSVVEGAGSATNGATASSFNYAYDYFGAIVTRLNYSDDTIGWITYSTVNDMEDCNDDQDNILLD